VLVVDDDADNARELVTAMKLVKLKASSIDSAKGALNILNTQKYELILLDIKMPEINGLELCSMVRRIPQHSKTPIVFVTGAATPESRANSTLAGGNDLIAKPFDLAEIALKSLVWVYKGQIEAVQKLRQAA
jgi:CheY-like chemotaxis protein